MLGTPARLDWFFIPFCLVFVAAGLVLTFGPLIADPQHPDFLGIGDAWIENGPKLFYMDHVLHQGELPLWNPLTFCGHPAAANPQYFVFYPPNLLRSLLTPDPTPYKTHVGIAWMVFGHLLFAGFTTFLLARSHGLSGPSATIAAFAFVFSAPMVSRGIGHWQFDVMVAWLPLDLLLLRKGILAQTARRALPWFVALGLAYGATLLGGSPQFMLLIGFMLVVYWLVHRLLFMPHAEPAAEAAAAAPAKPRGKRRRKGLGEADLRNAQPEPSRRRRAFRHATKPMTRDVALGLLAIMIALAFASPMLLSAAEFSAFSARAEGAELEIIGSSGDEQWPLWRQLIVYSGSQNFESIRAAGAGVLILSLAALLFYRARVTALFAILLVVFLDLSLNEPFLFGRLFIELAPYSISSPARAMLVACLPLGILAGLGFDALLTRASTLRLKLVHSAGLAAIAAVVLVILYQNVRHHAFLPVGLGAVICPLVLVLVVLGGQYWREPIVIGAMVAMLLMGESLAWNRPYIRDALRPGLVYPHPIESLYGPRDFWQANRRGTVDEPNLNLYDLVPAINGHDPLHIAAVRDVICHPFEGDAFRRRISPLEVTAYSFHGNGFLKRPFWLARQYADGPLPNWERNFAPTTTVFLDSPDGLHTPKVNYTEVDNKPVSANATQQVVLSRQQPPKKFFAAPGTPAEGVTWATRKPIPANHAALSVAISATAPVVLRVVFANRETGAQELGRFIHLDPAPERIYRYNIPMPDYTLPEIGLLPVFDKLPGTLTVHELILNIDENDEDALIDVVERTANTVEVELRDLPDYRILAFIDSDYPGWRATLDGDPVPILRANDAFKAIEVPPGTHRVRFEFRPARMYWGLGAAVLALTTSLLIMAALMFAGRRQR